MSGLKTEIIPEVELGSDSLCLDQYPDGSVRLICDEDFQGFEKNTGIYKRRAMINLSKKQMIRLIHTYLKNDEEWGSLSEDI